MEGGAGFPARTLSPFYGVSVFHVPSTWVVEKLGERDGWCCDLASECLILRGGGWW